MEGWEYFKLEFDPGVSDIYPHGYWTAYAEPGYDAAGPTVEIALAGLVIELAKALHKATNT